jgi:hypothetical protein
MGTITVAITMVIEVGITMVVMGVGTIMAVTAVVIITVAGKPDRLNAGKIA